MPHVQHAYQGFATLLNDSRVLLLDVDRFFAMHCNKCPGSRGPFAPLISHVCSVPPSCDRLPSWFQHACCDYQDEIAVKMRLQLMYFLSM